MREEKQLFYTVNREQEVNWTHPQLNHKLSALAQVPVDARALDAQQHSQVDGGPAWWALAAVTAQLIARQALHPLK